MSELAEVCQRVARFFELMNIEVPSPDTDLFETGLLDSMSFVQLLLYLEQQLGLAVSLDQLEPENFRSIDSIALFVSMNWPHRHSAARLVT